MNKLKHISLSVVLVVTISLLVGYGLFDSRSNFGTTASSSSNSQSDQLNEIDFPKTSPLYKIITSPLSKKYTNKEIGFSIMLPEGVVVKEQKTYSGENMFKVLINEEGQEPSITDLWEFYSDNKNPARNSSARSLDDYSRDYPAPDKKDHTVVIHKSEKIGENVIKQEYSYGYYYGGTGDIAKYFAAGTEGCDACYYASHYIRYVYFDPESKKFFILESPTLRGVLYDSSIFFKEKEKLQEKIAKTLTFK